MTKTYGPLRRIGAPVVSAFGVLGLVLLAGIRIRTRTELTPLEEAILRYETHREEFDEWITTAVLPASAYQGEWAEVDTLEDLVDLAIDTDERVVEDPENGVYVVRHERVTYRYTSPTRVDSGFRFDK